MAAGHAKDDEERPAAGEEQSGRSSVLTQFLREHGGVAPLVGLVGITTIIVGLTTAFGAIRSDHSFWIVVFGGLSILFLWASWPLSYLKIAPKLMSISSLGVAVISIVALLTVIAIAARHGSDDTPVETSEENGVLESPIEGWAQWNTLRNRGPSFGTRLLTAVARPQGEINVFVVGDDGQVWNPWTDNLDDNRFWHEDTLPENDFLRGTRQVTAVTVNKRGHSTQDVLFVFAIGNDGQIWWTELEGRDWKNWEALPAEVKFSHATQAVAAVSRIDGVIDLFAMGIDGQVWSIGWEEHTKWKKWFQVFPSSTFNGNQSVSVAARSKYNVDLFVVGQKTVWSNYWYETEDEWHPWVPLAELATKERGKQHPLFPDSQIITAISKPPDHDEQSGGEYSTRVPDHTSIDLFGVGADGRVWSNWFEAGRLEDDPWYGWFEIGRTRVAKNQQLAAIRRGAYNIEVFGVGADGKLLMTLWKDKERNRLDGRWSDWVQPDGVGDESFSEVAVVSTSPDTLNLFAIGHDGYLRETSWRASDSG
ncbi:hypothetical protein [Mycobacterium spongiae]|uniref:Uncharacterized protein n=1 Tax=Mycobacterium spongiae TaxID=886343 RepID=A0A975JYJ3_9MYCO|nr:hypothetical protein [Mycobacterium spongiae]QUR68071.1 hypothetical protein F6B93_14115 [Mycobacterium spongiae]